MKDNKWVVSTICVWPTLCEVQGPFFGHFYLSFTEKIFLHIRRLRRCAFSNIVCNAIAFYILPLFLHMSFCNPFWLLLCKEMQFFFSSEEKKIAMHFHVFWSFTSFLCNTTFILYKNNKWPFLTSKRVPFTLLNFSNASKKKKKKLQAQQNAFS